MQNKQVILDFGPLVLEATLFDSPVAARFLENLPYTLSLTQWGDELYGSIGIDLGENNPVPEIPAGGVAYTGNGNFLCIFFGQTPAWPVEYIGQINGDSWKRLSETTSVNSLTVRLK